MNKKDTTDEQMITGKWKATAIFHRNGKKNGLPRRFVHNRGIREIEDRAIQSKIVESLRMGYEVRLFGGSIRLYHCVDRDYNKMYVAAKTLSDSPLRKCVADIEFEFTRGGDKVETEDVEELERDIKSEHDDARVTPDTMVQCPKCGKRFRVGKVLG